jgi:hypothetical protein
MTPIEIQELFKTGAIIKVYNKLYRLNKGKIEVKNDQYDWTMSKDSLEAIAYYIGYMNYTVDYTNLIKKELDDFIES